MKMLSPEHRRCRLVIDHPFFGRLIIGEFQRTVVDLQMVETIQGILWQGSWLPVLQVIKSFTFYTIVVPYDYGI